MARNQVAIVSAVLFIVLAALLAITPVPYVTWEPGPVYNILSKTGEKAAVTVEGLHTFDTSGQLLLTTVSETRSDSQVSLPEALLAHWGRAAQVLPRDWVYQPGKSSERMHAEKSRAFENSKRDATVAALRQAGHPVTELPIVSSVAVAGPAFDKLTVGDMVVKINGLPVETTDDVRSIISRTAVGDVVFFEVIRGKETLSIQVTTASSNTDKKVPVIGANFTKGYSYAPIISFGIEETVVGASGGLPLALGIYDLITEGDLLANQVVGASGTIDADGNVMRVSGIRQKVLAAQGAGATAFLLPAANCPDVLGLKPNLKLVKVSNLGEAIDALQLLADPAHADEVALC